MVRKKSESTKSRHHCTLRVLAVLFSSSRVFYLEVESNFCLACLPNTLSNSKIIKCNETFPTVCVCLNDLQQNVLTLKLCLHGCEQLPFRVRLHTVAAVLLQTTSISISDFSTSFTPVKQQTFWKRILSLLQSSLQWSVRKNTDNRNIMVTHTQTINGWKAKFYNHAIPAVFKKENKDKTMAVQGDFTPNEILIQPFQYFLFVNCFM